MRNLYMNVDGANWQAQAVLAYLSRGCNIEESYNKELRKYEAQPKVARWENCREQGYVIYMNSKECYKQINIAFFEHRNSDELCAVKWLQNTLNSPTITTADFGEVYKDKYDVSFKVEYGDIITMGGWIQKELEIFWEETSNNSETN